MHPLDILYTPLDTAPAPQIDTEKFLSWCDKHGPVQAIPHRKDASKSTGSVIYPWRIAYAKSNFAWQNNFQFEFPELAKFFHEAYELTDTEVRDVTLLPIKQDFSGLGFWHADPDEHGLRMYLENEDTDSSLLIRPTIEPFNKKPDLVINKVGTSPHVQDVEYAAKIISPKQTFFLNNVRAIHAVKTNKIGALRIAVIVSGFGPIMKMKPHLQNLITRSAEKYTNASILWTPPNTLPKI